MNAGPVCVACQIRHECLSDSLSEVVNLTKRPSYAVESCNCKTADIVLQLRKLSHSFNLAVARTDRNNRVFHEPATPAHCHSDHISNKQANKQTNTCYARSLTILVSRGKRRADLNKS